MLLQTSLEHPGIKKNGQEVNALHFFEIKENGYPRPKNTPILPVLVGKPANQALATIDIEGRIRKPQPQRHRLEE